MMNRRDSEKKIKVIRLNYFPTCYPDEDIRSISYRYHQHSGNHKVKQSRADLFEITHRQCIIPRNINILIERLPQNSGWSSSEILQRHSFYPIFRPFLRDNFRQNIEKSFSSHLPGNGGANLHLSTRLNKLTTTTVRYCPTCLMEDYKNFGECYIHRLHQIINIDVCHKHHIALTNCCPMCLTLLSDPETDKFLATPYCIQGHPITEETSSNVETLELKLALLKDYEFLLNHVNDKLYSDIGDMLVIAIIQRIPCTPRGIVSKKDFIDEFLKHISNEVQYQFQITREFMMGSRVFGSLFKANLFMLYPNLFMLMIRFLSGSMEAFINTSDDQSKGVGLGSGPWKCLNEICPHYKQKIIKTYTPLANLNKHIKYGAFTCERCGFTYSLGRNSAGQRLGSFHIIDRGVMWEKLVLDYFHAGMSIMKIAKEVYSSSLMVKRALVKANCGSIPDNKSLNEINESVRQVGVSLEIHEREKNTYYREQLIHLLKQDPSITRSDIRGQSIFKWLRINDKDWYDEVLPKKERSDILDCDELDKWLVLKIQEAAKKVYNSKPNQRILRNTIIKNLDQIDQSRLKNKKHNLPQSYSILELHVENLEDYLIRKLPVLILILKRLGVKKITWVSIDSRWKIYKNPSDRVKAEFEKVINAINEN